MSNNIKARQPVKPQRKLDGSLVGASLNVSNPAATGMDLSYQPAAMSNMFMNLPVSEIDFFDKNPRRQHDDELYQQIKDSIRATGVQQPVHVTRRPGGNHYILAQGGNTRLKIVKDLLQETGDSRFASIPCIYIEYTSDENIHIAHLIENEQRADMVFWDKACAYADVRDMLQAKSAEQLGFRKLEQKFAELGLKVSFAALSMYFFATDHLSELGKSCNDLSIPKARDLRKQQNDLLAQLKEAGRETEGFTAFWHNTLSDWSSLHIAEAELDVPALQRHLQQAFATAYGIRPSETDTVSGRPAAVDPLPDGDPGQSSAATAPATASTPSSDTSVPSPTLSDSVTRGPVEPAPGSDIRTDKAVVHQPATQPVSALRPSESFPEQVVSRDEALLQLHAAVHDLLTVVHIDNLLLLDDKMPYGFLLDFPDFSKTEWLDTDEMFLINARHPYAATVFTYLWVVSGCDQLFNAPQLTAHYNPFLNQPAPNMLSAVYRDMTLRDHVFNAGLGGLDYLDQMTMNMFTMITEQREISEAVSRFNNAAAAVKQTGLPDWDLYEEE